MVKSRLNLKIIKSYWSNWYLISLFTESEYIVRSSYFSSRAGPHKPSKSWQRYRPAASRLRWNRKRIFRGKCAIAAERGAIVADQCAVKQPCLHECPKNFKANLKQNSRLYPIIHLSVKFLVYARSLVMIFYDFFFRKNWNKIKW